nr:PAS domain-containing protein [uncultured Cohaesibacter sp.]
MIKKVSPTGIERRFGDTEILVSRTDKQGHITYCNEFFRDITGYKNKALLGQPHNCMRHPNMPRSIFKALWDGLAAKEDVFGYVQNLTTNGDYYWSFIHIAPSRDEEGNVKGYEATRRVPNRMAISDTIEPLYKELCDIENKFKDKEKSVAAGSRRLASLLEEKSTSYRNFVLSV